MSRLPCFVVPWVNFIQQRRSVMSSEVKVSAGCPKVAFSDFDFFRIVIGFIGDLANSLNALLTFIQNLTNFTS